jgi:hypothetical protein
VFHSPDFAKWQRCLLQASSTYITALFHMASPFLAEQILGPFVQTAVDIAEQNSTWLVV